MAAAFAFVAAPVSAHGATHFTQAVALTEKAVHAVEVADMDGDGHLDLVARSLDTVSVLLGDGAGGFDVFERPLPDVIIGGMGIGDIDDDGSPDVVVTDARTHRVLLLSGTGEGELGPPEQIASGFARSVAVADFAGDARVDIALTRWDSHVVLLAADGEDGFQEVQAVSGDLGDAAVVDDLDGDGRSDLALIGGWDNVVVYLQRPEGGLGERIAYPVARGPRDLAAADLDGDDNLDLVTSSNQGGGTISVLDGVGGGSFADAEVQSAVPNVAAIAADDLDGDGDVDLVLPPGTAGPMHVARRAPDGAFTVEMVGDLTWPVRAGGVAVADFDEDGETDLALAVANGLGAAVALGEPLHVNPWRVDFGTLTGGAFATESFIVRNTGSRAITPGAGAIAAGNGGFAIVSDGCAGVTLQRGDDCSVSVRFTAPFQTVSRWADVVLPGDALSGPRYVLFDGAGWVYGTLVPDRAEIDFGYVRPGTTSAPQRIELTNAGADPIGVVASTVEGVFAISSDGCEDTVLESGAQCALDVVYRPRTSAAASAPLQVTYWMGERPVVVQLQGTGARPPLIRPQPPSRVPRPMPLEVGTPSRAGAAQAVRRAARGLARRLRAGRPAKVVATRVVFPSGGLVTARLTARVGARMRGIGVGRSAVGADEGVRVAVILSKRGRRLIRAGMARRLRLSIAFRPDGGVRPIITRRLIVLRANRR